MYRFFLTDAVDFAKQFNESMKIGESESNPLGGLNDAVTDAGSSTIRLVTIIGLIVVTIGLIIAGVKIGSSNARTRDEGKQKAFAVIIASAVLTGLATIFFMVQQIADGFM